MTDGTVIDPWRAVYERGQAALWGGASGSAAPVSS